jgi:hypothetical protein
MKLNLCPNCKSWLRIKKKQCRHCGLQLEADFEENPLVMLSREEQDFILDFVLCGGNFKALSEKLGASYPTLRSYLDTIIAKLRQMSDMVNAGDILEAIDEGKIRPEEGIEKLKKLRREVISHE